MGSARVEPVPGEPEQKARPVPRRASPAPTGGETDQRVAGGNRALANRMQAPGAAASDRGIPTLDALAAAYPHLMALVPVDRLAVWEKVIAGWRTNRDVDDQLAKQEERARIAMYGRDGSGTSYRIGSDFQDQRDKILSRRVFVDEAASRFTLRASDVLAADVLADQPWNVAAEHRFRTWLVAEFAARPLVVEITSRREIVSAMEDRQNPDLAAGKPHLNLLWGSGRIKHTRGVVTFADLLDIPRFRDAYAAQVTNGPEIQALRTGLTELKGHLQVMEAEHQERSDINEGRSSRVPRVVRGTVRRISESLGRPSEIELAVARMQALANPSDRQAQLTLAELQGRTEDYPQLRTTEWSQGIWQKPWDELRAAQRLFDEGKTEIALAVLSQAEQSATVSTARYAGYERRITEGATTAVKWLQRAKTAGKIASAFTGTGGVLRAAAGAAGYSFAQEGLQQVAANAVDPNSKIDLGGLAEQAAIEGLAALLGGVTQGAFVKALGVRFGSTLTVRYGLSQAASERVLSAVGATTASFYGVPAKIVLEKIIAGTAIPTSLAQVCDLVATEAATSAVLDVAGNYVQANQAALDRLSSAAPARPAADAVAGEPGTPAAGQRSPDAAIPPPELVHALSHPDAAAAGRTGTVEPRPAVIDAHARQLAQDLAPLLAATRTQSRPQRLQAIRDAIHARLLGTGLPRPHIVEDTSSYMDSATWIIHVDYRILRDPVLSVDQFARGCEVVRHEMEHALQFFRIARRQAGLTAQPAPHLGTRLNLRVDVAQAAIDANLPGAKVEQILAGSTVEAETDVNFASFYGANSQHRNTVYADMTAAKQAYARLMSTPGSWLPGTGYLRRRREAAAIAELKRSYEAYRALPEEVAAFSAGAQVKHAVLDARLEMRIRAARDRTVELGLEMIDAAGNLSDAAQAGVVPPAVLQANQEAQRRWDKANAVLAALEKKRHQP